MDPGLSRRDFVRSCGAALVVGLPSHLTEGAEAMYGRIGKIVAQPGERDALIRILLEGAAGMPGCLSYVVARDSEDEDGIWITEVWEDRERHRASLELPSVQDAMGRGRPLIASFGEQVETTPVGGAGLGDG